MLPRAMTLSLDRADVLNSVPCGRMNPRLRVDREDDETAESVDAVDEPETVRLPCCCCCWCWWG
jgi:hypothetical protein